MNQLEQRIQVLVDLFVVHLGVLVSTVHACQQGVQHTRVNLLVLDELLEERKVDDKQPVGHITILAFKDKLIHAAESVVLGSLVDVRSAN